MTTELFLNTMTKKAQLECYLRDRRVFKSSDVIKWGTENYSNRADRYKRELAEEGKIRRYTDEEKANAGFNTKESVYVWIGK